jgi:hypothetical protein
MYLNLRTKELFILMLIYKIKPTIFFFLKWDYKTASKLLERCLFYKKGYRIVFTNSAIFSGSVFCQILDALPMMAPLANCVAWLNVSLLLLIQNQSLGII